MKRNLFSLLVALVLLLPNSTVATTQPASHAISWPPVANVAAVMPSTAGDVPTGPLALVGGANVPPRWDNASVQAIDMARAGSPLSSSGTFTVYSTIYLPLIQSSQPLTPVIPATTKVLTGALAANLVAVAADTGVLTFTQLLTQPLSLAPGDVIVSAPITPAPNGLLRRVLTITTASSQAVVGTAAATLEDAMQQGEVHVTLISLK
jgi:hypothetical protein